MSENGSALSTTFTLAFRRPMLAAFDKVRPKTPRPTPVAHHMQSVGLTRVVKTVVKQPRRPPPSKNPKPIDSGFFSCGAKGELRGLEPLAFSAKIAVYLGLLFFGVVTHALVVLRICVTVLRGVTVLEPELTHADETTRDGASSMACTTARWPICS